MGIEPTHKGFADLSLTTWVPRRQTSIIRIRPRSVSVETSVYFFAGLAVRASRRKRADSSGGVGLM